MEFYKGTQIKCNNYNNTVGQGENYTGTTIQWAEPVQINGDWYIPKHPNYTHGNMEIVTELPEITE